MSSSTLLPRLVEVVLVNGTADYSGEVDIINRRHWDIDDPPEWTVFRWTLRDLEEDGTAWSDLKKFLIDEEDDGENHCVSCSCALQRGNIYGCAQEADEHLLNTSDLQNFARGRIRLHKRIIIEFVRF